MDAQGFAHVRGICRDPLWVEDPPLYLFRLGDDIGTVSASGCASLCISFRNGNIGQAQDYPAFDLSSMLCVTTRRLRQVMDSTRFVILGNQLALRDGLIFHGSGLPMACISLLTPPVLVWHRMSGVPGVGATHADITRAPYSK